MNAMKFPRNLHSQKVGERDCEHDAGRRAWPNGSLPAPGYIVGMCGRATYKLTWEEIVALYRLTLDQPPVNTRARYNFCPTTTIDTILDHDGKRRLERMRWGLIPSWWSKPLKEMKLATFNARAETVATKPMFRSAFKRSRCLIPVSGYGRRQAALVLHGAGWLACTHDRRPMG
jgi:putative SOS response-associated peptidase YedK